MFIIDIFLINKNYSCKKSLWHPAVNGEHFRFSGYNRLCTNLRWHSWENCATNPAAHNSRIFLWLMLIAALISRSYSTPYYGHCQIRLYSGISDILWSQQWQFFELANHWSPFSATFRVSTIITWFSSTTVWERDYAGNQQGTGNPFMYASNLYTSFSVVSSAFFLRNSEFCLRRTLRLALMKQWGLATLLPLDLMA